MQTETYIDKAGRFVIAKDFRDGTFMRTETQTRMVEVEGLWVHESGGTVGFDVLSAIEAARNERLFEITKR